jgi:uncharacterized protein with HEPN domain
VGDCIRAGRDEFPGNVVYQDAVMRNLEIIGEAAKRNWQSCRGDRSQVYATCRYTTIPSPDLERVWLVANAMSRNCSV